MLATFNIEHGCAVQAFSYEKWGVAKNVLLEKLAELLCIQGCGHDDNLEGFRLTLTLLVSAIAISYSQDLFQTGKDYVCAKGTFVCFIHDNHVVAREKRIGHHLPYEHSISEVFDSGSRAYTLVKAYRVPDEGAKNLPLLSRDAIGERGCCDTSRLRDGDLPKIRAILEQVLGKFYVQLYGQDHEKEASEHTGCLSRSRFTEDDGHVIRRDTAYERLPTWPKGGGGDKSYDRHFNESVAPRAIGNCSLCSRRDGNILAFPLEAESVSLSVLVEWVLEYFWRL